MTDLKDILSVLTANDVSQDFTKVSLKPLEDLYKLTIYKLWDLPVYRLSKTVLIHQVIQPPVDTPEKYLKLGMTLLLKLQEFTTVLTQIREYDRTSKTYSTDIDSYQDDDTQLVEYFNYLVKLKELKDRWDEIQIIKIYLTESAEPSVEYLEQSVTEALTRKTEELLESIRRDTVMSNLLRTDTTMNESHTSSVSGNISE